MASGEDSDDRQGPNGKPLKKRRISRACDYCHQRGVRCRSSASDSTTCQNCQDFGQPCTYNRQIRRRGPAPGTRSATPGTRGAKWHPNDGTDKKASGLPGISAPGTRPDHACGPDFRGATTTPASRNRHQPWEAPRVASQATIMDLVELYFEIVYPIFPFFHQPSFMRSISRAEYTTNRSLFAVTMAVCALVSSRVRDGSISNPRWNVQSVRGASPDAFYGAADGQLESGAAQCKVDLNHMRSQAIMALVEIQNGRARDMQRRLGIYHTLVAVDGLHDEANWPRSIGAIEREERRRLFWSIYTLEVYTAVVWGGVVRAREQQSNVAYPIEVDDECIDECGVVYPSATSSGTSPAVSQQGTDIPTDCWLSGWNFITDLYRVLEHALARFRGKQNRLRRRSLLRDIFDEEWTVTKETVRDNVMQMYINLPDCFKETPQMTYNIKKDRFGFQAANVTATLQLVRMVLFADSGASIADRCQIASDVVNAFVSIPVAYQLAISRPLLHHLGGIGAILGAVFEEPLCEADYSRVRSIMLSMAQLLENLEGFHQSSSASGKLRSQVARIDDSMASQRLHASARPDMAAHSDASDAQAPQAWANPVTNNGSGAPFMHAGADIHRDWSFQIPPGLLDELNWNFDMQ